MVSGTNFTQSGDAISLNYAYHRRKNAASKAKRREASRQRAIKDARTGNGPNGDQLAMADILRARGVSRQALIDLRMTAGFVHRGGPVGGNPNYVRAPFVYEGLVSWDHPMLELFVQSTRKAKHLLVGDNKGQAVISDSKLLALDAAYVESNKLMRRVLRAEVDGVFANWDALKQAVIACRVPLPNLVIAFIMPDGRVVNPHLIWLIAKAVPHTAKGQLKHQALFASVLRSLTAELLAIGADPGGLSNPARHKNPLSPLWDRAIMEPEPYTLEQLQEALPLSEATKKLKAAKDADDVQKVSPPAIPQEHPAPIVAASSNKLFVALQKFAFSKVEFHRAHGSQQEFAHEVAAEAIRLVPYGQSAEKVAAATAASVSAWTWDNYRPKASAPVMTPEMVSERQSAGQAIAAESRRQKTAEILIKTAVKMTATNGVRPTQAELLKAAKNKGILGEKTIRRYWPEVLKALENLPVIQSPDDKKGKPPRPCRNPLPAVEAIYLPESIPHAASPPHPAPSLPGLPELYEIPW